MPNAGAARALFDQLADASASDWDARLAEACPDDAGGARRSARAAARRPHRDLRRRTGPGGTTDHRRTGRADRLGGSRRRDRATPDCGSARSAWCARSAAAAWARSGCASASRAVSRRTVAIKLIRSGWDAADTQRRFLAERQILAGLQHPNIAHLIDGGVTADGKPWLALEYVDGESLLDWCDGHRLGIAERLRLFRVVCDAVAHAHQRPWSCTAT